MRFLVLALFIFLFSILQSTLVFAEDELDCGDHGTYSCLQCYCDTFWSGVRCGICINDQACENPNSPEHEYCSTTPYAVKKKVYQCVPEEWIQTLLGMEFMSWTSLVVSSSEDASKKIINTTLEVWKGSLGPILMVCDLYNCEGEDDESTMSVVCTQGTCSCSDQCAPTLTGLANAKDKRIGLVCDSDSGKCKLTTLTLPNGVSMSCSYGECVSEETIPSKSASSSSLPSATVFAFLLIFSFIGFILIVYILWSFARKKLPSYRSPNTLSIINSELRELTLKRMTGAYLSFQNISYSVNNKTSFIQSLSEDPSTPLYEAPTKSDIEKKHILKGVSGFFQPGHISAIMGPSGAGKSSLLHILADWKDSSYYTGNITVNGKPVFRSFRKSLSAYVLQEEHLVELFTVKEMMRFVANLKLSLESEEIRETKIMDVLDELNLTHVADTVIGDPFGKVRGLSGGERRRVSIALELLSSPRILFLDEPTTGLDSSSALNVMECLRKLANANRTIICTIHQPRMSIFNMCDYLLLLSQGQVVYSGPTSNSEAFFSDQGITNSNEDNVADFLIDTVASLSQTSLEKIVQAWKETGETYQILPQTLQRDRQSSQFQPLEGSFALTLSGIPVVGGSDVSMGVSSRDVLESDGQGGLLYPQLPSSAWENTSATGLESLSILCQFERTKLLRDPNLLRSNLIMNLVAGFLTGLIFVNIENDLDGLQSQSGCLFLVLVIISFGSLSSLEIFMKDRDLFLVQKTKGYYTAYVYLMSKVFLQVIPIHAFGPIILGSIVFWMAGLNSDGYRYYKFLIVVVLHSLVCVSCILCISSIFNTFAISNLLSVMLMLGEMVFAGFLVNPDDLPKALKPVYDISYFHFSFEDLVINQFQGQVYRIELESGNVNIKISGESFISQFGLNTNDFDLNLFLLTAIIFALIIVTYFFLHWRSLRHDTLPWLSFSLMHKKTLGCFPVCCRRLIFRSNPKKDDDDDDE